RRQNGRGERGGRGEGGGRRWALTREQRLTYMKELPKDNNIGPGAPWSDPAHAEVSLEQGFADDIGAHLGSTLTFNIQGVPVDLKVTSLRTVNWQTSESTSSWVSRRACWSRRRSSGWRWPGCRAAASSGRRTFWRRATRTSPS